MKLATSEHSDDSGTDRAGAADLGRFAHFLSELRRRRVFSFTAGYAVTAWVAIEVANVVLPAFDAPKSALQVLIIVAVALAPAAMVLAWFYDLTRHGLVLTDEEDWKKAAGGTVAPMPLAAVDDAPDAAAVAVMAAPAGLPERRLVTVLQCSFDPDTGSVDAGEDDTGDEQAERFREAIPQLVARFDEIVRDVEGYLLPSEGEVLTAYFGVASAHEDDALRALLAAQRMLRHVGELNEAAVGPDALRLRIGVGLHCGHAIVEERPGRPVEQWVTNVGHAQNGAAALQVAAANGEIRLSREVRAILHERIPSEPVGEQVLPGNSSPVTVYRIADAGLAPLQQTPTFQGTMLGRERELALLEERWAAAVESHGSVVVVRGEAGMGKSRLVARFRELVEASHGSRIVALQCSSYFAHSPLQPVLRYVAQCADAAAASSHAPADRALADWLVGQGLDDPELPRIVGEALSRQVQPEASLIEPGKQKEMLLQALLRILLRADTGRDGEVQPVFLLVEDLHWADPTTLELLELLVGHVPSLRALMLVTVRPGCRVRWLDQSDVLLVSIHRLTRAQSQAIVEGIDRDGTIGAELREAIVAKADGVPLFVEELAHSVIEEAGRHKRAGATSALTIPDTLQESLAARIQRLGTAKPLLQLAATIGREFRRALLEACAGLPTANLDELLGQLVERELIQRRGVGAQASYVFRHALIQDAAYGSMLKSRREECHLLVAQAMERDDVAGTHNAELLAYHYGAAESTPDHQRKSIDYWLAAAQVAVRRSANLEADHFLDGALQQLQRLPATHDRDLLELRTQVLRIPVLVALHGYSSQQMALASHRALTLCDSVRDFELRYMALFSVCVFDMVAGRHQDSHQTALKLARLDADNGAPLAVESEMLLGLTHFFLGKLAEAEGHLLASISAYDREQHGGHAYRFGQDPEIVASSYLSWTLFCRGDEVRRTATEQGTLARARSLGHPNSLGFALAWAGWSRIFTDDLDGLEDIVGELATVAREYGLPSFVVQAQVLEALRSGRLAEPATTLAALEQGLDAWRGIGSRCFQVCWDVQLARACLAAHQSGRAAEILARAESAMEATDERWSEPDLHRCRAQLELALGRRESALACLERARAVAAQAEAWGWYLAATRDAAGILGTDDATRAQAMLDDALARLPH